MKRARLDALLMFTWWRISFENEWERKRERGREREGEKEDERQIETEIVRVECLTILLWITNSLCIQFAVLNRGTESGFSGFAHARNVCFVRVFYSLLLYRLQTVVCTLHTAPCKQWPYKEKTFSHLFAGCSVVTAAAGHFWNEFIAIECEKRKRIVQIVE